jgi:hypothetical protein
MLVRFLGLHNGFELLKGNIHDQDEPPNGEFTMLMLGRMLLV